MLLPTYKSTFLKIINEPPLFGTISLRKIMLVGNEIKIAFRRGVWGASPPEAEEIFKKSNKMEAFPLFFLLFGRAP